MLLKIEILIVIKTVSTQSRFSWTVLPYFFADRRTGIGCVSVLN